MSDAAKRTFRVGLVGCGRISKNHFDALSKVEGLTLAAVADTDFARAQASGAAHGVPAFPSLDEMLRGAELDLVTICTPSGLPAPHGVGVAQAGNHLLNEKPQAI